MSHSIDNIKNQETVVFNVTTANYSNLVQSSPNDEQNEHTNTSVRFLNGRENVSIQTSRNRVYERNFFERNKK